MIDSESKTEGKVTIFHLKDDLTSDRTKSFLKKMEDLISEGRIYLVLDLEDVDEVSLIGMVGISSIFNKCRHLGGALKISNLSPSVRRAFRATNLINTLEVFDTTLDAIKSFRSQNLLKSKNFSGSFFVKEKNAFVGWDRLPMSSYLN
jgi:anti-anti-sigma factor